MNFETAAEYFSCINIYRIIKLDSHQFFKDKITSFQIEHHYMTRASSLEIVDLPFYRLSKSQRSFLYKGLTFWNKIPIEIRNIPDNLRIFKKTLRKYIFDRNWFTGMSDDYILFIHESQNVRSLLDCSKHDRFSCSGEHDYVPLLLSWWLLLHTHTTIIITNVIFCQICCTQQPSGLMLIYYYVTISHLSWFLCSTSINFSFLFL